MERIIFKKISKIFLKIKKILIQKYILQLMMILKKVLTGKELHKKYLECLILKNK